MRNLSLKLCRKAQALIGALRDDESGQDLVEYALILALVALASVAALRSLANAINTGFSSIAQTLSANV
jgi:pilus assembly protein Flp/PilA